MIKEWFENGQLFSKWVSANWGAGLYYVTRKGMSKIVRMFYRGDKYNLNLKLKNYVSDDGVVYMNLKTINCNMPTVISALRRSTIVDNTKGWHSEYEHDINRIVNASYEWSQTAVTALVRKDQVVAEN